MIDVKQVADGADLIVNGYAFTRTGSLIRILNLNQTNKAAVISTECEVLETSMDDKELKIMLDFYNRNRSYMEV